MPVTCISSTGRLRSEPAAAAVSQAVFVGPATPSPPDEVIEAAVPLAGRDRPDIVVTLTFLSLFGLLLAALLARPLLLA